MEEEQGSAEPTAEVTRETGPDPVIGASELIGDTDAGVDADDQLGDTDAGVDADDQLGDADADAGADAEGHGGDASGVIGAERARRIRAIEAILMVADQPVTPQLLAEVLGTTPEDVENHCDVLAGELRAEQRGFVLARVAGGYRFQSHPAMAEYVERFVLDGQAARLSQAALETLAIVAYKQPISRAQVAAIRGVSVDAVLRTLAQRGYVSEVSIDPGPGHASLFGTTPLFLERLGLDHVGELPALGDLVPGTDIMEALEASLRIDVETGRPVRGPLGSRVPVAPAGTDTADHPDEAMPLDDAGANPHA